MDTQPETPNDQTVLLPSGIGSGNSLPVGTRLADFEITGVIGEGGFGIVYLAVDHSLKRTVAIKEYMPSSLAGRGQDQSISVRSNQHLDTFEAGLRSFINEARLLAQFDHTALVKVYRFWEQNKTAYMAMRYYEGRTLKNFIQGDPAPPTETWLKKMLKPVLEALEALHSEQILHRDISPDNIMIQKNGNAVLLDFGAARQIIGDMTQALTVILKPGYAPIEQYADDMTMKQGPWTDIYALSAVIYAAINKKPPPTSVVRMIKDPIEPLENGSHPEYSHEFLSAISKGLAVRPEDRPQTIEEFSRLLGIENVATVVPDAHPSSRVMSHGHAKPVVPGGGDAFASAGADGQPTVVHGETDATVINPLPPNRQQRPIKNIWAPLMAVALIALGAGGYYVYDNMGDDTPQQTAKTDPVSSAPASSSAVASASVSEQASASAVVSASESASASAPLASASLPEQEVPDEEAMAWANVKESKKSEDLAEFIKKYPSGKYTESAQAQMTELVEKEKVAAAAALKAENAEKAAKAAAAKQARANRTRARNPELVDAEIDTVGGNTPSRRYVPPNVQRRAGTPPVNYPPNPDEVVGSTRRRSQGGLEYEFPAGQRYRGNQ